MDLFRRLALGITDKDLAGVGNADTSNWQTYTNSEYKFEMKHPNDLIAEDQSVDSKIYTNLWTTGMYGRFKKQQIAISYLWITGDKLEGLSLEEWLNTQQLVQNNKEYVDFNDNKFLKIHEPGEAEGAHLYYITNGDLVITIGTGTDLTQDPVFKQILSDFRFLPYY